MAATPPDLQQALRAHGVEDERVLRAFREVPRDQFCLEEHRTRAWQDEVLTLTEGATLTQPSLLAEMIACLELGPGDRVLEIGSGSGYSTALLCELAGSVHAIEANPTLVAEAEPRLRRLGYANFRMVHGDGRQGHFDHAPYDAILVQMAVPYVPPALLDQLAVGGRLVAPVGGPALQQLLVYEATDAETRVRARRGAVRFVGARDA